jgi:PHP domain
MIAERENNSGQLEQLASFHGQVSPETTAPYLYHDFDVSEGMTRLKVTLRYRKEGICQLYLSVFGPNGYRGSRMLPGAIGDVVAMLEFGAGTASIGALAGEIEPGQWRVQLDLERTEYIADYSVTVEAGHGAPGMLEILEPAAHNGRAGAGWYRGELHSHSHHSDGQTPVADVVTSARKYGLDFLALTDHFSNAGWPELESLSDERLCVMQGSEITGHRGHANMHGLSNWINPFVDDPEHWSINDAARAVHHQGGLFCINHAFALDLGWRYHEFDWALADMIEVYHHFEGEGNTAQLALWDGLLRAGHRITGVAGTDTHDPFKGRHRLGQAFTAVHATALEPKAIIEALRHGHAYATLGPKLEFSASSGTNHAIMGDEIHSESGVGFRIALEQLNFPARVIVMQNGFYHKHWDVTASQDRLEIPFGVGHTPGSYFRVEVFARGAQSRIGAGRDWQNTLALSNPIYLR